MQWFGLLDCNNFYCSCERIFAPILEGKPIAVMSNNDGCIISRSQEVKDLGISMGSPVFQIKSLIKQHAVQLFSSNYTLYGDISARVMNTLDELCPLVEVYSIDEAFLDLSIFPVNELAPFARHVRATVKRWTKIPTCVGIARTKTLAKVANKIAKKNSEHDGVFVIGDEQTRLAILENFPVGDVWGIGRRYQEKLLAMGVTTALQFTQLPEQWVKANMTVVGHRLLMELRGLSCISMLEPRITSKNICSSRCFGKEQYHYDALVAAVSTFASRCGQKLREQKTCASVLSVFIQTNPHNKDGLLQFYRSKSINMVTATSNTIELIKYALRILKIIYQPGLMYQKAGVTVTGIIPSDQVTVDFFDTTNYVKLNELSRIIDDVNRKFGGNAIILGSQKTEHAWQTRVSKKSPSFTTKWDDLPKVQLE